MTREHEAEYLKKEIFTILESRKNEDSKQEIILAHVNADLFLEMAYCFIAKHGK